MQLVSFVLRWKFRVYKSLEEAEKTRNDNPSTYIHKLVDYLQKIKGS